MNVAFPYVTTSFFLKYKVKTYLRGKGAHCIDKANIRALKSMVLRDGREFDLDIISPSLPAEIGWGERRRS